MLEKLAVELPFLAKHDCRRIFRRPCLFVSSLRREGIINVADRGNSHWHADLISTQTFWIALAIHPFMVMETNVEHHVRHIALCGQQVLTVQRVIADQSHFVRVERAGLVQDVE